VNRWDTDKKRVDREKKKKEGGREEKKNRDNQKEEKKKSKRRERERGRLISAFLSIWRHVGGQGGSQGCAGLSLSQKISACPTQQIPIMKKNRVRSAGGLIH